MTHRPDPHSVSAALDVALSERSDRDALRATWAALPTVQHAPQNEARSAAWDRLVARLDDPQRVPYTDEVAAPVALVSDVDDERPAVHIVATPRKAMPVRALMRWAAAFVALAGGGILWRATPVEHSARPGTVPSTVQLADGSTIVLAPGARLHVPRALGWPAPLQSASRDVQLQGTAFFDVARDGRAFVVSTSDARVHVLGTRFEVRSPTSESGTVVQVAEGRVAVSGAKTAARVLLGGGEQTTVRATPLRVTSVSPARIGAWRSGGLAAVDEPLASVLAELARRYDVRIVLEDANAAAVQVSLFYPLAPVLETILSDLSTARGLRVVRTSEGFVLQAARE